MIATRFRSVTLALCCASAALGCYLVSLKVASERNQLGRVERQIAAAKSDIRGLQIEMATRGRLGQLEHWNSDVLGLAAPKPAQYLHSEVQLASLTRIENPAAEAHIIPVSAPVDAPTAPAVVVTAAYHAPQAHDEPAVATAETFKPAHAADKPKIARVTAAAAPAAAHHDKPARDKDDTFKPARPAAPVGPSLLHEANYVKPGSAAGERTALLDTSLLADISRAAKAEQGGRATRR